MVLGALVGAGLVSAVLGFLGSGVAPASAATLIKVDGSSTVFPITEAVAEEFQKKNPKVRVTVGISGTGGGFKKFCPGETDISDASRPIKISEVELCADNRVGYIELPVGYDGIAVMVNPKNDWVDHLTVQELKKMWEPGAQRKVTRWSQIRAGWPEKEIHLFGPGSDSGTYDYFTEATVGKEHSDPLALGFFGLAYYENNKDKLKLVPIDDGNPKNGDGPILPSAETVKTSTYQPLSRPIFIYASKKAADRPEIVDFVKFYLTAGRPLVKEVGYIPLSDEVYELGLKRFEKRVVGSVFGGKGGSQIGVTLESLLASESK
ncbi:MAG: PstS family phosphate ABC transporter substrate-binding protein [Nitrospirae bacterium]|nr:PstS family phosphate ABC transporter substrate-binding protein [Nitrospirota bacterium]